MGLFLLFVTVLGVSILSTPIFAILLRKNSIFDVSNERSAHQGLALRGFGISVSTTLLLCSLTFLIIANFTNTIILPDSTFGTLIAGGMFFAIIGFMEDKNGLSIQSRVILQIVGGLVFGVLLTFQSNQLIALGAIGALLIPVSINVHNFMDGINGISGLHGLYTGIYLCFVSFYVDDYSSAIFSIILAASFTGFLPWNILKKNWFLGDSGSYLLGGALALISVNLLLEGVPALVLLAPFVIYLADTSHTLMKRVFEKKHLTTPHNSHTYQQLARKYSSHMISTLFVFAFSLSCILFGVLNLLKIVGDLETFSAYLFWGLLFVYLPLLTRNKN